MPTVDAVVFTQFTETEEGFTYGALDEIIGWGLDNVEFLPGTQTGGWWTEVNDNIAPLLGRISCVRLIVTVATAQQFAADSRIFTLGRRIFDDDGNVTNSNWNTTLSDGERKQVLDWLENHGISRAQVSARFGGSDTRLEIATKLKAYFKE